jgi:Glycine cleavage T-protein C-terminal barrel domain
MGEVTRLRTVMLCISDQAFREIGRRGVEGVREQRPAPRLPERLDLWVSWAGRDGLFEVGAEVAMVPCDVYHVCVDRKRLYISEEHERALKARELGISEAEVVRRMLDGLLLSGEGGRGQVKARGTQRRLSCLVLADQGVVALGNEPVRSNSSEVISRVTSGGSGYSLNKSIAYAYLPMELAESGTELAVEVFGEEVPAEVVSMPLWDPKHERARG